MQGQGKGTARAAQASCPPGGGGGSGRPSLFAGLLVSRKEGSEPEAGLTSLRLSEEPLLASRGTGRRAGVLMPRPLGRRGRPAWGTGFPPAVGLLFRVRQVPGHGAPSQPLLSLPPAVRAVLPAPEGCAGGRVAVLRRLAHVTLGPCVPTPPTVAPPKLPWGRKAHLLIEVTTLLFISSL